ncbi:hypothetical protein Tco_1450088 [Tanacetum coccineum]
MVIRDTLFDQNWKSGEIEGRFSTPSCGEAAYNDKVVKNIEPIYHLSKKLPCRGAGGIDVVREDVKLYQLFRGMAANIFPMYAEYEPHFSHLPGDEDWDNVTVVCEVLKVFKMRNAMKEKLRQVMGECHLLLWTIAQAVLVPRMKFVVRNAHDHMFKEYVEMHDELVREAAIHKNRSCGGSTNSRSNEDLVGSEWEEFGDFYKGADVVAGGYCFRSYRSALKSNTVEMLLCGGDWIRQNYEIKKKVKGMAAYVPLRVLWPGSIIVFSLVVKKTDGD